MNPRSRRVAFAVGGLVVLLFAGRWLADFLVERWWAASASETGAVFAARWAVRRALLDAGAIVLAIGWFAGHLLFAARLAGRAAEPTRAGDQSTRRIAPGQLRLWALPVAGILGVLCGAGTADWAPSVALATHVPRWGIADPFSGLDFGFYVAVLPLLVHFQLFALALTLLGLVATVILYAVGGALRVAARRFTFDPRIRLHIGGLGAVFAVTLALGYLIEPYEFVAGLRPASGAAHLVLLSSLSWVLVGLAVAAGGLTLYWGLRGRIMAPVGAWAALGLFALVIRLLAPTVGAVGERAGTADERRELERIAFAVPELTEAVAEEAAGETVPQLPGHWEPGVVRLNDPSEWIAADRVMWNTAEGRQPVLLLVADALGDGRVPVVALRDDRVTAGGGPLAFRDRSTVYPGVAPVFEGDAGTVRPGAAGVRPASGSAGVAVGGFLRRLLLTWSLQRNFLTTDAEARVGWRLDPRERLQALAPFAEWGAARPRIVDDRLLWVSDGYLYSGAFPVVAPVPWRGRSVSYLRAAFTGVVDAETAQVRVFQRGAADPLTLAWTAIAGDFVEPEAALPAAWSAVLSYPAELFGVQAAVLRRPHWELGALSAPGAGVTLDSLVGPLPRAAFQSPNGRRLVAIVEGERLGGSDQLRLFRIDSAAGIEPPMVYPARWDRLPFIQQTRDSVLAAGWRPMAGPVRFMGSTAGPLSWQVVHAVDSVGHGVVVAVNLALAGRLGTGPDLFSAWENLRGAQAAFPVSHGDERRIQEAREWLARADSALRRGDLAAFGRAFEALRAILERR